MSENDYSLKTDDELFAHVKQDDELAFYEIFNRYWKVLYQEAFFVLRTMEKTETILQRVFTEFWEERKDEQINNVKKYLKLSARALIADYDREGMV